MSTVTITPVDPAGPGLVLNLVGTDSRSGGVGGWSELVRPRRTPATEWGSQPMVTMELPLLLDGMERQVGLDVSIEPQLRALRLLAQKVKAVGRPPVVGLRGPLDATPRERWVINDIKLGPAIRNASGQRVQLYVDVSLLQYAAAAVVRGPAGRWKDARA